MAGNSSSSGSASCRSSLVYGAYVAEVYRAGLESIHWSQTAAARSLGLSQWQTLRHVVDPAGGAPDHPAAAQRLRRAPEGHRARVDHRTVGDPDDANS